MLLSSQASLAGTSLSLLPGGEEMAPSGLPGGGAVTSRAAAGQRVGTHTGQGGCKTKMGGHCSHLPHISGTCSPGLGSDMGGTELLPRMVKTRPPWGPRLSAWILGLSAPPEVHCGPGVSAASRQHMLPDVPFPLQVPPVESPRWCSALSFWHASRWLGFPSTIRDQGRWHRSLPVA